MATPMHLQKPPQQFDEFTISDEPAAIEVVSRKVTPTRVRPADRVLVDRTVLDKTTPRAKAGLALLCWANSITTSMATGAQLQLVVFHHQNPGIDAPMPMIGILAGFALQALLTFGQVYTAERSRTWYRVCLTPDAAMTAFQWAQWIFYPIAIALLSLVLSGQVALFGALAIAGLAAWAVGVYSAQLPERMIFGQRRGA
jgi:hypothetical protein